MEKRVKGIVKIITRFVTFYFYFIFIDR